MGFMSGGVCHPAGRLHGADNSECSASLGFGPIALSLTTSCLKSETRTTLPETGSPCRLATRLFMENSSAIVMPESGKDGNCSSGSDDGIKAFLFLFPLTTKGGGQDPGLSRQAA